MVGFLAALTSIDRPVQRPGMPCKVYFDGVPVNAGAASIKPAGGTMRYFLCVMGMVMIIEGLPYFAWPERMKTWLMKILEAPDGDLRKIGAVLIAAGLVLVWFGRA